MITFQKIKYKNILSTGETWTEINLDQYPTTLVMGKNGAGKSTFLDALFFGLYGKPFRKITIPQLINATNEKGLLVEVYFSDGVNQFKVVRGQKPKKFEIYQNDVLIPQDAKADDYQSILTDTVLKMTHKTASQVVVLGSAIYTPFMQLEAKDRRAIIEDLLDINVFSEMASRHKDNVTVNKENTTKARNLLQTLKSEYNSALEYNSLIDKTSEDKVNELKEKISQILSETDVLAMNNTNLKEDFNEVLHDIESYTPYIEKKNDKNMEKINIEVQINELNNEIRYYETHENCVTCHQNIDLSFKEKRVNNISYLKDKLENQLHSINGMIEAYSEKVKHLTELVEKKRAIQNNINYNDTIIESYNKELLKNKKELVDLKSQNNVEKKNVEKMAKTINQGARYLEQLETEAEYLKVIGVLLKDTGIKASIIKKYIDIINVILNDYLEKMDLYVNFTLDENFDETIKSRFRENFTYNSFSQGEKLRIDLAILFTWRDVTKMRNSVSTNLMVMDEVLDSSMDEFGRDELLKIIKELTNGQNTIIISHSNLHNIVDSFDRVIQVENVKGFSRVTEKT